MSTKEMSTHCSFFFHFQIVVEFAASWFVIYSAFKHQSNLHFSHLQLKLCTDFFFVLYLFDNVVLVRSGVLPASESLHFMKNLLKNMTKLCLREWILKLIMQFEFKISVETSSNISSASHSFVCCFVLERTSLMFQISLQFPRSNSSRVVLVQWLKWLVPISTKWKPLSSNTCNCIFFLFVQYMEEKTTTTKSSIKLRDVDL